MGKTPPPLQTGTPRASFGGHGGGDTGLSRAAIEPAQGRSLQERGPGLNPTPPKTLQPPRAGPRPAQTPHFSPVYRGVPPGAGLGTAPLLGWPCHLLAGLGTAGGGHHTTRPGDTPQLLRDTQPHGDGDRTLATALCAPRLAYLTRGSPPLPPPPLPHQMSDVTPTCAVTPGTTGHHQVPSDISGYHRTSPGTTRHQQVPSDISGYHQTSPGTTRHHQVPPDIIEYQQQPPGTTRHHQVPHAITRYHRTSLGTTDHHRVPSGITGYYQTSLGTTSHHHATSTVGITRSQHDLAGAGGLGQHPGQGPFMDTAPLGSLSAASKPARKSGYTSLSQSRYP
ncbi:uncharacterized protein ACIBXB_001934 [Morphnus guianensis]